MKFLFILLLLPLSAFAARKSVTIDDVAKAVSSQNYIVYENALKVYQAKANVEKARADLLPRLSIWTIAKIAIDPSSIIDSIKDIAPFLVPANWFRLEQTKLLLLSTKEGYRALWANEIHSAKALYSHLVFDSKLLAHVRTSMAELERMRVIAETHEMFGGAPPGTARDIEIKILGLKEDDRSLQALIQEEVSALGYALGLPAGTELVTTAPPLPNLGSHKPLVYGDFEFRVLANSPERRQYDHFLSVLKQIENEISFSFLGGSSISRGVAGGVFDSLPTPDGLGFGQGPAMQIVEAQREIMLTQKRGIEETLKRQLGLLVSLFNLDLGHFSSASRRAELVKEAKVQMINRMQLGERINVLQLADLFREQIQSETAVLAVQFRAFVSLDRLNRMLLDKEYGKQPPFIDKLKGTDK